MPTVLDFINNTFKKAGVEMSASMKEALNNPELTKVNLDDELAKKANESLMTIEVAKENPILKQHFRASSLNPIDTEIEKLLTEYEVPDAEAAAIKAEKNTYEKIPTFIKVVKAQLDSKATKAVGDKATLIKTIEEKDAIILSDRAKAKLEKEQLIAENKNKERDWNISGSLAGYNYSKTYGDRADAIALAKIKLERQLASDGAKVILGTDGMPKLVSASDEALEFTRESQKVSYKDYIDKLVADNKMIEVTETGQTKQTTVNTNTNTNSQNGQTKSFVPPRAMTDIDNDLQSALKANPN